MFRVCIWPVYFLRRTDDKIQLLDEMWKSKFGRFGPEIYDGHNAEVKRIVPKEKLLVYDVRDGWEPLCEFLGVPVPQESFPQLNDTQAMKAIYYGQMAFGACAWAMYLSVVAGLVYLAFYPEVPKNLSQRVIHWTMNTAAGLGLK